MQDAFRSSPPTVYEMRGSVKHPVFVRARPCLCTHTRVSPDLLDYLVDYHLALNLHI